MTGHYDFSGCWAGGDNSAWWGGDWVTPEPVWIEDPAIPTDPSMRIGWDQLGLQGPPTWARWGTATRKGRYIPR